MSINPSDNARTIYELKRQIADLESQMKASRVAYYALFEQQAKIYAQLRQMEAYA